MGGTNLVSLKISRSHYTWSQFDQYKVNQPICLIWLVVDLITPLKNMSSSVGMILPNIWKKIHFPNHQPVMLCPSLHPKNVTTEPPIPLRAGSTGPCWPCRFPHSPRFLCHTSLATGSTLQNSNHQLITSENAKTLFYTHWMIGVQRFMTDRTLFTYMRMQLWIYIYTYIYIYVCVCV